MTNISYPISGYQSSSSFRPSAARRPPPLVSLDTPEAGACCSSSPSNNGRLLPRRPLLQHGYRGPGEAADQVPPFCSSLREESNTGNNGGVCVSVDREESGHGSAGEAVLPYCSLLGGFVLIPVMGSAVAACCMRFRRRQPCRLHEVLQSILLYLSNSNKLENIILLMKFLGSLPFFPVNSIMMNMDELSSPPWFSYGGSDSAVAMSSFLPNREQPYSIVASLERELLGKLLL